MRVEIKVKERINGKWTERKIGFLRIGAKYPFVDKDVILELVGVSR